MSARHQVPSATLILALLPSACQSSAQPQGQAARLRTVTEAAQQELTQALKEMTGASQLRIDIGQFSQTSTLTLERVQGRDANGVIMQGADRQMPEIFQLRWADGQCRIVQLSTGKSRVLQQADCLVAP
jgi:hypothetical protein